MTAVRWLRFGAALLLIVAVALQLPHLQKRHATEAAAQTVELAMDLPGARLLAEANMTDTDRVVAAFRDAGITSLVVWETTPKRLAAEGRLWLMQGDELREQAGWRFEQEPMLGTLANLGVLTEHVTIVGLPYSEDGLQLETALRARFVDPAPRLLETVGERLLIIPALRARVEETRLGLDPADLAFAASLGLRVIPRLYNYPGATDTAVREAFAALPRDTTVWLPSGHEMIGYPDHLNAVTTAVQQHGIALGIVETPEQLANYDQAGQAHILASTGHQAVRTVRVYMKEPAGRQVELDRWLWPIKERNVRLLYLSPYMDEEAEIGVERHIKYVQRVRDVLEADGYTLGVARPFPPLSVPRLPALMAGIALGLAGWLLLGLLLPAGHPLLEFLTLAIAVGLGALLGLRSGTIWREGLALAIACVFPALASLAALELTLFRRPGGDAAGGTGGRLRLPLLVRAVLSLVTAGVIALAGGLLIASLLGDSRYLLELRYFRGVKISFLIPLLLVAWGYIRRCGVPGLEDLTGPEQLRELWHLRLELRHVVLAAGALLLVALYVFRGGHGETGFGVSGTEHAMRRWLEQAMWARPRLKEFLIGHPALILLPVLAAAPRRWGLLLGGTLAATVGTVSIVNTFEHLRTPLALSLPRVANGAWLGLAIGLVLLLGLQLLLWAGRLVGERGR